MKTKEIFDKYNIKYKGNPTRTKLGKYCLKLWGDIIKQRNGGVCEYCQIEPGVDPHHIVDKKVYVLKFDLRNGCLLCKGCHETKPLSVKNDPLGFTYWFKNTRPSDYEYLMQKKNEDWDGSYERVLEDLTGNHPPID